MSNVLIIFLVFALLGIGFIVRHTPTTEEPIEEVTTTMGDEVVLDTERIIDLSGEGLDSVPQEIFTLTNAEQLLLENNNLTGSLPAEVRFLQELRVLDLSGNRFTGVPAEIGQLTQLEILDLSHNPITGLPHELGNLQNLKVLNLRDTNYSRQDLDFIRNRLSASVEIQL